MLVWLSARSRCQGQFRDGLGAVLCMEPAGEQLFRAISCIVAANGDNGMGSGVLSKQLLGQGTEGRVNRAGGFSSFHSAPATGMTPLGMKDKQLNPGTGSNNRARAKLLLATECKDKVSSGTSVPAATSCRNVPVTPRQPQQALPRSRGMQGVPNCKPWRCSPLPAMGTS